MKVYSPWNSPGQNSGEGCYFLLQGTFTTQGLNWVSCIAERFFTVQATREAYIANKESMAFFWLSSFQGRSLPVKLCYLPRDRVPSLLWSSNSIWGFCLIFYTSKFCNSERSYYKHININVQGLCGYKFSTHWINTKTVGSYRKNMFTFVRNCQTVFQSGCTILLS